MTASPIGRLLKTLLALVLLAGAVLTMEVRAALPHDGTAATQSLAHAVEHRAQGHDTHGDDPHTQVGHTHDHDPFDHTHDVPVTAIDASVVIKGTRQPAATSLAVSLEPAHGKPPSRPPRASGQG